MKECLSSYGLQANNHISHSIQHYVISLLMTYDRLMVSSTDKTDCHDITEILLKVAFNTRLKSVKIKKLDQDM